MTSTNQDTGTSGHSSPGEDKPSIPTPRQRSGVEMIGWVLYKAGLIAAAAAMMLVLGDILLSLSWGPSTLGESIDRVQAPTILTAAKWALIVGSLPIMPLSIVFLAIGQHMTAIQGMNPKQIKRSDEERRQRRDACRSCCHHTCC